MTYAAIIAVNVKRTWHHIGSDLQFTWHCITCMHKRPVISHDAASIIHWDVITCRPLYEPPTALQLMSKSRWQTSTQLHGAPPQHARSLQMCFREVRRCAKLAGGGGGGCWAVYTRRPRSSSAQPTTPGDHSGRYQLKTSFVAVR